MHQRANPTPSLAYASRPQPWASVHCQPESLSVSSKYTSRPVNLPRLWPRKILQSHDQEASSFMRTMSTPDWNMLPLPLVLKTNLTTSQAVSVIYAENQEQTCCLCSSGFCSGWSLGSCLQDAKAKATPPKKHWTSFVRCTQYTKPEEVVSSIVMVNDVPADLSKLPIASWKPQQNQA